MTGRAAGLRVAFAGGNGYPPEAYGGVQSSTHDLATRLMAAGASPSVLAPLYGDGAFGLVARVKLKLAGNGLARDTGQGYPVYRAWFPERAVGAYCQSERPDIAVVQCHGTAPLARAFRDAGVPVVVYLRNVEFHEIGGDPRDLGAAAFIANSRFTAERYRTVFGISATIIPPTLDPSRFATDSTGEFVTFIGPVPEKGLDKALAIARRCPDIPFLFCESWLLDPPAVARLTEAIRPYPNIRFQRRVSDVRSVYGRTRIVLAPSMWEEAWGRVASEAHCSGIPVLGSTRGGLPEAIGPGGVTLDYDAPVEEWVAALRRFWDDPEHYRALGNAAKAYSERPEMDASRQFKVFLSVLTGVCTPPVGMTEARG